MKLQWICCIVFTLFLLASTALAQAVGSVYWQSNGGGCVPTDETIRNQDYWTVTGGGRVKYKGNGTKPLVFTCPINSFNYNVSGGDATVLRLFYQDSDGAGNDFKVQARLLSFNKENGALGKEVCKVTSAQSGQWAYSIDKCGSIKMNDNLYWVEVVITRTKPSVTGEFNGVSLEGWIM
ncbi:hypothetical protein [Candidatus Electronema sp. JC]|uniref:hypothetical protein n=1 Tax=Candidatus Electronema sp. JC TaxID=3401570 RepID=UPI003B42B2D3